jgi:hypothetical protein
MRRRCPGLALACALSAAACTAPALPPRAAPDSPALASPAGSLSAPAPAAPSEVAAHSAEAETDVRTELLDPFVRMSVEFTAYQERMLANGALDIVANLSNRAETASRVEVQCVFRNIEGAAAVEATAWRVVVLAARATETLHFTSSNRLGTRSTIRVRQSK